MEKKNPYITTIGFKKDDPDHVYVAELLNSMGRGKAQYIVKAILAYQKLLFGEGAMQTSEAFYDYETIRSIVLQIIEQREKQKGHSDSVSARLKSERMQQEENNLLAEFDETDLSGIRESIAAFQNQ